MMVFDEKLCVSEIRNIVFYSPEQGERYSYPGCLPTYELLYYTKGEAYLYFGGKSFHVKSGDVLYLPKGIHNAEYSVTVKEKFALYNIYFDCNEPLPNEPLRIRTKSKEIESLYEKMYRDWFSKRDGYHFKILQRFYRLAELLHKEQLGYSTPTKTALLAPAEAYMSLHYCDADFDYKCLTDQTGLSYSYFKKLFFDKYGMTPVKYITHLRINRACELLQTKMFSVTKVAELCGFDNVYYFSNVFKKSKGISPKNYSGL